MEARISPIQMKLLMLCRMGATPLSMDTLSQLLEVGSDALEATIPLLLENHWLERTVDGSVRLRSQLPGDLAKSVDSSRSISTVMAMVEKAKDRKNFDHIPAKLIANAYHKANRDLEGAALLHECALGQMQADKLDRSARQCRECIALLRGHQDDREACGLFLDAVLLLSSMYQMPRQGHDEIRQMQAEAAKIARRIGNQRSLAMLHFHKGRAKMHLHMLDEALAELEKGFALIDDLADEDILARSSPFRAYYFFTKGLCRETYENAEKALSFGSNATEAFDPVIIFQLAMSAAHMGHLSRAIGVMYSNWRQNFQADKEGFPRIFYQIFLGQMLLAANHLEDSIYHLKEAKKVATSAGNAMGVFWANRAIACHHFAKGRYQDSYETLSSCMADIRQSGFQKLYYGIPVLLEMLFQFHGMGYAPIPGYDFASEIEAAINGPHALLRGVALRIRAKDLHQKGATPEKVRDLLLRSESDLEQSGAEFELAKTRAELALLEIGEGDLATAELLARKAWDGWMDRDLKSFPSRLNLVIATSPPSDSWHHSGKNQFRRYMAIMDDLMFAQERDEIMIQLLSATCKFFESERGGIFFINDSLNSQKLTMLNGLNLTEKQAKENCFVANLEVIKRTYDRWKPAKTCLPSNNPETLPNKPCYIICLPIMLGTDTKIVIYCDAYYNHDTLEIFNELRLEQLANYLEKFILKSLEYSASLENKTSNTLSEITKIKSCADELPSVLGEDFHSLLVRADQVAQSDASVIILGETGVGKGVLARRIHDMSPRSEGPFVSIDVSSIPESLVESELFGHEKGAFTGADRQKQGLMELANKGTLFIDEIGETPKSIQVKLLRAIEDRSFVRVGGVVKRVVDFRLLTATNRDLVKEVEKGNFREDLYYRLCVVPFIVPPLRERGDDVIVLAEKFLAQYARKYNRSIPSLSAGQKAVLRSYPWPGNVRELRNVIERSVILSSPDKLQLAITTAPKTESQSDLFSDRPTLDEMQRRYISQVVKEAGGKLSGPAGAAEILGIKRTTLQYRMKKLGLTD